MPVSRNAITGFAGTLKNFQIQKHRRNIAGHRDSSTSTWAKHGEENDGYTKEKGMWQYCPHNDALQCSGLNKYTLSSGWIVRAGKTLPQCGTMKQQDTADVSGSINGGIKQIAHKLCHILL